MSPMRPVNPMRPMRAPTRPCRKRACASRQPIASEQLLGVIASDQANLGSYALAAGATPSAALAPWVAQTRAAIPGALIEVSIVPTAAAATARSEIAIRIRWTRTAGGTENVHQVTACIAT